MQSALSFWHQPVNLTLALINLLRWSLHLFLIFSVWSFSSSLLPYMQWPGTSDWSCHDKNMTNIRCNLDYDYQTCFIKYSRNKWHTIIWACWFLLFIVCVAVQMYFTPVSTLLNCKMWVFPYLYVPQMWIVHTVHHWALSIFQLDKGSCMYGQWTFLVGFNCDLNIHRNRYMTDSYIFTYTDK